MPERAADDQRLLRTLSLDALRGFEAAARHLSFTAAADELCLTQSAVSKQVRLVEQALGVPLFARGRRGLRLTPAGRELCDAVRGTLRQLAAELERCAGIERRGIALTLTPSFASLWLAPRLAAFAQAEPGLDLRIDASEQNRGLEREGFDLALRLWPSGAAPAPWRMLARERVMLVAAPALAARVRTPADLHELPLLAFEHAVQRYAWMAWSRWYERLGLQPAARQPVFRFSQYEHLVRAAAEGAGVAIGRTPLVSELLRAQRLAVVLPETADAGLEYCLALSEHGAGRPEVQRFVRWLERELAADGRA